MFGKQNASKSLISELEGKLKVLSGMENNVFAIRKTKYPTYRVVRTPNRINKPEKRLHYSLEIVYVLRNALNLIRFRNGKKLFLAARARFVIRIGLLQHEQTAGLLGGKGAM